MKLDPRKDSVFSTRDEKVHTELRAKMMGAVSNDALREEIVHD